MRFLRILFCWMWLGSIFGWVTGVSDAREVIPPEDQLQQIHQAINQRVQADPLHRQIAKDLRELALFCRIAEERLRTKKQDAKEAFQWIESKAEELKQDQILFEKQVAERKFPVKKYKAHRPLRLIDSHAAAKQVLSKLPPLQERLTRVMQRVNQEKGVSSHQVQSLLSELRDLVFLLDPPSPKKKVLISPQPTHGLFQPKRRPPREQGGVVPAYVQPGASGPQQEKTPSSARLWKFGMSEAYAFATGAPTPDDLKSTLDAAITPEIQTLAAQLGNSASVIYEYVRNTIEFESYYGSLKGSLATLWSGRGNDVDQSSLLIALLRAAGIPCRYIQGTVDVPIGQAKDWLGVKDAEAAADVLAAGFIPVKLLVDQNNQVTTLRMEHVWVEVYVPYGYYRGVPEDSGTPQWIPLDPSMKVKTYQPGLSVFSSAPFDEEGYLAKRQRDLPTDFYQEQLIGYLHDSYPGRSITEIGYLGPITKEELQVLPSTLPYAYRVVAYLGEYSELPGSLRNSVEAELLTVAEGTSLLKTSFVIPEVIHQRITLSYPDGSGGVIPTIRVDGKTVASGSVRSVGEAHQMKLRVHLPNVVPEETPLYETIYPNLVAGEYYAIGLDAHQASSSLMESRINRMLEFQPTIGTDQEDFDETVGEFLNVALLLYFQDFYEERQLVGEWAQTRRIQSLPNIGLTRANLNIETAFDLPFTISPGNLVIDVRRSYVAIIPIDGEIGKDRVMASFRLGGWTASALEHEVWEELVKIESVSTVKGLQFANEMGIPILEITPSNLNEMLAILDSVPAEKRISQGWRETIVSRLSGPSPVDSFTTPQEKLFYNDWKGSVGFVVHEGGSGLEYLIEGGLAGGGTTWLERIVDTVEKFIDKITGILDAFFDGDPVNIANGNLVHTETDFTIKSRGLPILWKRVYNSRLNYDGALGFGWVHFYEVHLTENADGSVTFSDDDGGQRTFTKNQDSSYTAPPGHYLTLTKSADGFQMRDKSGLLYQFRHDGKLTALEDPHGNKITLTYEGSQLVRVTDALGRSLTLTYNGQGKIAAVKDFTDQQWSYAYDANNNLIEVTDPLNQKMKYEYLQDQYNPDNNHNIQRIVDREGHGIHFEYYTNDRVFRHTNDLGETRTFSYNVFQQETSVINENGFEKIFKYDDQGNLEKLIEETDALWRYTWDDQHNRLSDTDPLGNLTTYTYDDLGNVLTIKNPLGHQILHTYEPTFSKRTSTKNARGFRTNWEYDPNGNLVKSTDPLSRAVRFEYDSYGNRTAQVDPRGVRIEFGYDSKDNLMEQRARIPEGDIVTHWEYDDLGRMTARVDANQHRIEWVYDVLGQITQVSDATGGVTSSTYDKNGRVLNLTDAENRTTRFEYDAAGRRTKVTDALTQLTEFRYDKMGNVIAVVAANGTVSQMEYDGKGNLTKTTNPMGEVTTNRYNLLDRVVEVTDPNSNKKSFEYDALQRLSAVTDALGNTTRYSYDPNGNRTQITDAEARLTEFIYDPLNRLVQVVDPLLRVTDYGYDEVGNLIRITDANGHTTFQEFDELSRLVASEDPLGNQWQYTYDGVGNRTSLKDPNNQTLQFRYDELDRLTKKIHPDLTEVSLTYDKVGNRLGATNAQLSYTYRYDALNRLVEVTDGRFGKAIQYTYDAVGNRLTMTDLDGFVTSFQYDAANRLIRITDPFGGTTQYSYDSSGRRVSRQSANQIQSLYTYDVTNRLTELILQHAETGNEADHFRYTYDRVDNRLTMEDQEGPHSYRYDALDRLIEVNYPDKFFESLTYDAVGNRISKSDPSGTTAYSYDVANRLLQAGATQYQYDANGNQIMQITTEKTIEYQYDPENRLVAVEDEEGPIASYAYDADGRRVQKEVKGLLTQYLYNSQQILAEYSSTKAVKARYIHGGGIDEVLLMVRGGKFSYLHQDGLGSVTAVTDDRGVMVEDYRYRAFGEVTVVDAKGEVLANSAVGNPYLFTGREWDQETGLYYYRARYYASGVGRFLTPDPFPGNASDPGSWHRYSYVGNNPINRLDPLGLRAEAAEQPSRMSILEWWNQGPGGFTPSPPPLPPGGFTPSPIPDRGPGGFTPSPPPERPGGFTPSEPGSMVFYDKSKKEIIEKPGGLSEAEHDFGELSKGGRIVQGTDYPGVLVELPDGTRVGLRPESSSGPPTVDVHVPQEGGTQVIEIKYKGG